VGSRGEATAFAATVTFHSRTTVGDREKFMTAASEKADVPCSLLVLK
jgi:hypothetical protein